MMKTNISSDKDAVRLTMLEEKNSFGPNPRLTPEEELD